MDNADKAEAKNILRFNRFEQLWREIEEAERRAEAHLRLEHALHYSRHIDAPAGLAREWAA